MLQFRYLHLGALLALSSFVSHPARALTELKICSGQAAFSNVLVPISPTVEKEYQIKIVPGLNMDSAGSEEAYKGLLNGTCEAAVVPSDFQDWIQALKDSKVAVTPEKFTYRVIGRDRIKVVSHPSVKLETLSKKQLADIFAGKVENWKDVGGPDLPIKVAITKAKLATLKVIQRQVLKGSEFSPKATNLNSYSALLEYIEKNPGAVSFMSGRVESQGLVQLKTDSEFGRPMTMITIGKPSDHIQKILELIRKRPDLIPN